jgi:hypothetical protein
VRASLLAGIAGVVILALTGLGGAPADCVATAACDCETVGSGAVRQPAGAWSSLALCAAGVWVAGRPRVRMIGVAAVGAGLAAFLFHATATAWAARLDGAGVALVAAGFVVAAWHDRVRAGPAALLMAAVAATALAGRTAAIVCTGAAVALAAAGLSRRPRPDAARLVGAAAVFALGTAIYVLGDSGGPLCRPESPFPGHALWHMAAAAALGLAATSLPQSAQPPLRSPPDPGGRR